MKKKGLLTLLPLFCFLSLAAAGPKAKAPITINAASKGAIGDGKTLNTGILQSAIDEISKGGGGTLVLSDGEFLTGGLFLKDNVELRVEAGATLLGSTNPGDYAPVTLDNIPQGRGMDSSRMGLIVAQGVKNVKITGFGVIDGQGRELALKVDSLNILGLLQDPRQPMAAGPGGAMPQFPQGMQTPPQGARPPMAEMGVEGATQTYPELVRRDAVGPFAAQGSQARTPGMPQMNNRRRPGELLRQKLIFCSECDGVTVENLHLRNSSVWGVSLDSCENVKISGVDIHNRAYWNNDGIDLTDSRHVLITGCNIDAADDGICLKSNREDAMNEDITITSCSIRSSASAIKFGTASYGAWNGVTIKDIEVRDTFRSAIAIESVDGARIENILVDGIYARNTGNAIFIRLGQRAGDGKGYIRNITVRNLSCEIPFDRPDVDYDIRGPIRDTYHNQYPCSITGLPSNRVENVTLENIELIYPGRASKAMGYIPLSRLDLVAEQESGYPEYSMFGELPAYAFYVRHADDVSFKNIRLFLLEDDFRPAFVLDDANGILFEQISLPLGKNLKDQIFLNHSKATIK